MTEQKSDIAFTSDIIKRVAKELNVSEKEVSKVYYTIVGYLDKVVRESKHVAVKIPKLGYFYATEKETSKNLRRLEFKKRTDGGLKEKDEKLLKGLWKKYATLQDYKKSLSMKKLPKTISYHYRIPTHKSWIFARGKKLEELEDFQKELADK